MIYEIVYDNQTLNKIEYLQGKAKNQRSNDINFAEQIQKGRNLHSATTKIEIKTKPFDRVLEDAI